MKIDYLKFKYLYDKIPNRKSDEEEEYYMIYQRESMNGVNRYNDYKKETLELMRNLGVN